MLQRYLGTLLIVLPLISDARGGRSGSGGGLGLALVIVVCAGYLFSKKK